MESDGMMYTPETAGRPDTVPLTVTVDLTRDEFIKFNLLVSRIIPREGMRKFGAGYLMILLAGALFCIGTIAMEWLAYKRFDPIMAVLLLMMILSTAASTWGMSARIRAEAGRDYDETLMNGQNYYGNVFVFPDRIEKHSERNTTILRFDPNIIYFEAKDMIVFATHGQPAIVIPARCISGEQMLSLQKVALPGISQLQHRISGQIEPAGQMPEMPVSIEEEEDMPAIHIRVTYTRREMRVMALESAVNSFSSRLPSLCMIAMFVTLMSIVMFGFGTGALAFLLTIIVFLSIPLLTGQIAVGNKFRETEDDEIDGFSLRVTDISLTLRLPDRRNPQRILWNIVTRAIERPAVVDFHFSGGLMRIPKRCMNEATLCELRETADRKMPRR